MNQAAFLYVHPSNWQAEVLAHHQRLSNSAFVKEANKMGASHHPPWKKKRVTPVWQLLFFLYCTAAASVLATPNVEPPAAASPDVLAKTKAELPAGSTRMRFHRDWFLQQAQVQLDQFGMMHGTRAPDFWPLDFFRGRSTLATYYKELMLRLMLHGGTVRKKNGETEIVKPFEMPTKDENAKISILDERHYTNRMKREIKRLLDEVLKDQITAKIKQIKAQEIRKDAQTLAEQHARRNAQQQAGAATEVLPRDQRMRLGVVGLAPGESQIVGGPSQFLQTPRQRRTPASTSGPLGGHSVQKQTLGLTKSTRSATTTSQGGVRGGSSSSSLLSSVKEMKDHEQHSGDESCTTAAACGSSTRRTSSRDSTPCVFGITSENDEPQKPRDQTGKEKLLSPRRGSVTAGELGSSSIATPAAGAPQATTAGSASFLQNRSNSTTEATERNKKMCFTTGPLENHSHREMVRATSPGGNATTTSRTDCAAAANSCGSEHHVGQADRNQGLGYRTLSDLGRGQGDEGQWQVALNRLDCMDGSKMLVGSTRMSQQRDDHANGNVDDVDVNQDFLDRFADLVSVASIEFDGNSASESHSQRHLRSGAASIAGELVSEPDSCSFAFADDDSQHSSSVAMSAFARDDWTMVGEPEELPPAFAGMFGGGNATQEPRSGIYPRELDPNGDSAEESGEENEALPFSGDVRPKAS
ncbi:unnamed protein product [Amoebophrya sp. A120]|nr:unnamed protein product [Amoebophrya sp. A120]|eukprot:GSA120T00005116001.1